MSAEDRKRHAATMKGPAIFLNQFAGDAPRFNTFEGMCGWAAALGYKRVQIATWDERFIDIARSAIDKKQINRALGLR